MTSDEEATADTARFLKPNLADEEVLKRAKSNVRSLRDCGAASAVGAGPVAVSLLIGAGNVALDAFYVLMAAQALLLCGAQFFDARSERFMAPRPLP